LAQDTPRGQAMNSAPKIVIAGCGPGHIDYVTPAVHYRVAQAEVLIGASHLLDLFSLSRAIKLTVGKNITAVLDTMQIYRQQRIVVLVSGDTGLFSLAHSVQQRFGHESCQLIPGISSIQVACARLGIDWDDLRIISAHGRTPQIDISILRQSRNIAILAGTSSATVWAAELLEHLGNNFRAIVCENLTLADEKVHEIKAEKLRTAKLSSRTIIVLLHSEENA